MKKLIFLLPILFLLSCSHLKMTTNKTISLSINISNNVNSYNKNSASPVVLRLYQLSTVQKFSEIDFIDLYHNDEEILGNELVSRKVLPPYKPGNKTNIKLEPYANTRYLGVMVEFANFKESSAIAMIKLTSNASSIININVSDLDVTLSYQ